MLGYVAAKNQRCSEETVLNNYLQIGNRTGILMSNVETVLQPSEGCTAERLRRDLFCAWSMFGKLCLN